MRVRRQIWLPTENVCSTPLPSVSLRHRSTTSYLTAGAWLTEAIGSWPSRTAMAMHYARFEEQKVAAFNAETSCFMFILSNHEIEAQTTSTLCGEHMVRHGHGKTQQGGHALIEMCVRRDRRITVVQQILTEVGITKKRTVVATDRPPPLNAVTPHMTGRYISTRHPSVTSTWAWRRGSRPSSLSADGNSSVF